MASHAGPARAALQQLSQQEIDRRIAVLAADLLEPAAEQDGSTADRMRPHWITPAELVRRMRPVLVWN
jgi:hypothetical protein